MEKQCSKCEIIKPIEQFYRDKYRKDGRDGWCKKCKYEQELLGNRKNFAKNIDAIVDWLRNKKCSRCKEMKNVAEFNRQYKTKDGFQTFCKTCERERKLDKKYNLTQEEFVIMVNNQNGECLICGKKEGLRLHIDHSHITGKIRGLLCLKCNRGIGLLEDNEAICQAASDYLTKAKLVS